MGVMPCARKNCENVMCDHCVDNIGYICNECITEFKEEMRVIDGGVDIETSPERIKGFLENFMETKKKKTYPNLTVEEFFNLCKTNT